MAEETRVLCVHGGRGLRFPHLHTWEEDTAKTRSVTYWRDRLDGPWDFDLFVVHRDTYAKAIIVSVNGTVDAEVAPVPRDLCPETVGILLPNGSVRRASRLRVTAADGTTLYRLQLNQRDERDPYAWNDLVPRTEA